MFLLCAQCRWKQITTDATGVDGQPLVTVILRLVKGEGEEAVGPEVQAKGRPRSEKLALGAVMPTGGTAEEEVEAIDKGIMVRYRGFLKGWGDLCKKMFPDFEPANIPDSSGLNWDRINGGTAMSDASPQAQKMSGKIVDKVKEVYISKVGVQAWEALTEEEQVEAVGVIQAYCHNHLRNTCVRHAVKSEQAFMLESMRECLNGIGESYRVTTNVDMVARAACKEFTYGATRLYAKGQGATFYAFCLHMYPLVVIFTLSRVDLGVRQDSSTEIAVPLWMNRRYFMHFLAKRISSGGDNKLETCLFVLLGCLEIIAAIRCRAIVHIKVTEPLRFFTNDSELNFTALDMGPVLDALYDFLNRAKDDGALLMDITLDIFEDAVQGADKDRYEEWKLSSFKKKGTSVNGEVKVNTRQLVLGSLFEPEDADAQATDAMTRELLMQWCEGWIEGMVSTPTKESLTALDGKFAAGKATTAQAESAVGSTSNSDDAENFFGCVKYFVAAFAGVMLMTAVGLAMAKVNKSFHQSPSLLKKESVHGVSYFDTLAEEEKESLVEFARREVKKAVKVDQSNFEAYVRAQYARTAAAQKNALARATKAHAEAERYFAMTVYRGSNVQGEVDKLPSKTAKLKWLKAQINIRVKGWGWTECKVPFSSASDTTVGTVETLIKELQRIIKDGKGRAPPKEAPVVASLCRKLPVLGTLSKEAIGIRAGQTFSREQLRVEHAKFLAAAATKVAKQQRAQRDKYAPEQPTEAPTQAPSKKALVNIR